jgi:2-keto-3-deoxy-L-rhamnonate aldolase RhmA
MVNKIRELISQGRPTLATHLYSTWPTIWEVVGSTRQFDYMEFESQWGAYDLHDLDNMCRAAELTNTGTMIKIDREPKDYLAGRAIAAGFEAILFADIMTAKEAEECVEAVRLPPEGSNGAISTRGMPVDDFAKRTDDIVIAVMVEKKTLMEELEDVLAVDGLDMIQFGPTDYGLSLRTPGKPFDRAELQEKIEADRDRANQMAIDAGIRPRAEGPVGTFQYFLQRGVRDFCIGADTRMIREWCEANGKKMRDALAEL